MDENVVLSERESEIAELLAWGAAKKEVADKLQISTRTVESTARNVYKKIGIQKATELCVWWFTTHCGVSMNLSPFKRKIGALFLLLLLAPTVFGQNGSDMARYGRRASSHVRARTARTGTARKGDTEIEYEYITL